jgi:hypothetical protein
MRATLSLALQDVILYFLAPRAGPHIDILLRDGSRLAQRDNDYLHLRIP